MKQLIKKFIPDENAAWKAAALVLLFLLVVTLIVNSVMPFAKAVVSAFDGADVEPEKLTTRLVEDDEKVEQLNGKIAEKENEIAQLNGMITGKENEIAQIKKLVDELETENTRLENALAESAEKSNQEQAKLQEALDRNEAEIAELRARLEDALVENEARTLELEALREKNSRDHVIVIKLCRTGLLGTEETIYIDWHVPPEEYTRHQIGEQMQPVKGLDFPTGGNWVAVIMNMYIDAVEV